MADDLMPLADENFRSLEEKFAEEIEDLKGTLAAHQQQQRASGKQPNVSFVRETNVAIKQSEELLEELREARRRYGECTKSARPFTDEEVAAFRYFGFNVHSGKTQLTSSGRENYTLPSQSSARSQSAVRDVIETETDVADVQMHREATPEDDLPDRGAPYVRHADIEGEVSRRVGVERERMEQEVKERMKKSAEAFSSEVEQRVLAVRNKMQHEFDAAVRRASEHSLAKISQENAELKAALQKAAEHAQGAKEPNGKENSSEWLEFFHSAMVEENKKIRSELQHLRSDLQEKETKHVEDYAAIHQKLSEHPERGSNANQRLRDQLRTAFEADDVVKYTLMNCEDPDTIDEALIDFLNSLNFPFVIHLQRLGRGGDYFIDKRVQIRLANGELVVRSRTLGVNNSISGQYEPLAKYLAQLYAPLLLSRLSGGQLDDEQQPTASHDVDAQRVQRLREEQALLQRRLAEQEDLLKNYQQQLSSRIHPSPEVDTSFISKSAGPEDSVPQNINEVLKQEQRRRLEAALQEHPQEVDSPPRRRPVNDSRQINTTLASIGYAGKPAKEMLSKMTPQEIEELKRRAFLKQVREMKQRQANATR